MKSIAQCHKSIAFHFINVYPNIPFMQNLCTVQEEYYKIFRNVTHTIVQCVHMNTESKK